MCWYYWPLLLDMCLASDYAYVSSEAARYNQHVRLGSHLGQPIQARIYKRLTHQRSTCTIFDMEIHTMSAETYLGCH